MASKIKIVIAVVAIVLVAVGLILYFHQPPKPVRIHQLPTTTELVGVGLQLQADPQTGRPVIVQVVPNSPAAAAGITRGQTVSKVSDISLGGKTLVECVNLIRGPVGSIVRLELVAPDGSRTNTVELIRQKLKV